MKIKNQEQGRRGHEDISCRMCGSKIEAQMHATGRKMMREPYTVVTAMLKRRVAAVD